MALTFWVVSCVQHQCVGVSAFGFIVANISSMLATLDVRGAALAAKMSEVREYLHERDVPLELQLRVLKFFSHLWANKSLFDEVGILSSLPPMLRNQVVLWSRRHLVDKVALFKDRDESLLSELLTRLTPHVVEPQEILTRPRSTADQMFFVLQVGRTACRVDMTRRTPCTSVLSFLIRVLLSRRRQGVVEGYIPRPHTAGSPQGQAALAVDVISLQRGEGSEKRIMEVVSVVTVGDHCGHTEIVTNTARSIGLRALTICHLQTLSKVRQQWFLCFVFAMQRLHCSRCQASFAHAWLGSCLVACVVLGPFMVAAVRSGTSCAS